MFGRKWNLVLLLLAVGMGVVSVWAQDCAPVPPGIVGWWPGEGNARDLIGGNSGSPIGNVTFQEGVVGQAFILNNVGFLSIPDSPSLRPAQVTVEAWVRFDTLDTRDAWLPGLQYIVFKKNSRSSYFEGYSLAKLRFENEDRSEDRFVFTISSAQGAQIFTVSTTAINVGQFYHVAGTYDGNTMQLYVNGVAADMVSESITMDYDRLPLYVGISGQPSLLEGRMEGAVDELSIYNRGLSASEIQAIFAAGSAGKCRPE